MCAGLTALSSNDKTKSLYASPENWNQLRNTNIGTVFPSLLLIDIHSS